ncbi:hypothetical protein [Dyella sp. 2HG41-7]|uniref:hypothetical protein n=1 Tax=Dyella sp. 2HG41-7 TaxID=2883239 RepID=UPI001F23ED6B|nr:hypothetical protein [Dyella sp. 2HG41-7]
MLSFLLQKSAWPDHPMPFRLVNVGLHLLNGVLVFLLVLRLARNYLADHAEDKRAWLAACLATAAWLLDPIQISGVVLVVQRMTLLMAFFVLLGLLAYLRALLATSEPLWRRGAWLMFGLGACMGLAFLSKENGILLPLYALVLDATVLRQAVHRLPRKLLWLRRLLIWPPVLFVIGYLLWQIPEQWGVHGFRDFTLGERLLTEPRALVSYLGKTFLPQFGLYGLYHDSFAVSQNVFSPWTTAPSLLALLAALMVSLGGMRRWPLLSMAILWYLGGQLLESSTTMLELYFEHRNYMPLVGVMAAIAIGIARQVPQRRRVLLLVYGLWLLACCFTTALSASVYASADRLAATWAHSQPDSIRAQTFLAQQLLQHGMVSQSLQVIETIDARHQNNAGLAENRVYLLCMEGQLTTADVQRMDDVLRVAPFDRSGFENVSTLRELASGGHCPAFDDQAWLQSANILLDNPAYRNDGLAAGFLHYQKHFWAVAHGQLGMTIQELDETFRNDPDAEIPRLQAKYLASAGLYGQAMETLRRADYSHLPFLRHLLVDDRAINTADIAEIEKMRETPSSGTNKAQ